MIVKDLFADAPLPADKVTSMALQQLLREPINVNDDWQRAENLLLQVDQALGGRLETKVALYKMYAYSNRFEQSFELIHQVLQQGGAAIDWPADWRQLPDQAVDRALIKGPLRLYLYSMKALGFVSLRSGQIEQAVEVLNKLELLDPADEVGGSVVRGMAESLLEAEQD
ncbi:hypothetical protein [Oceanobacter mangrovi]|uniref:hypothetical protein n=1 Tax=Oceanobacter mangrovi TaxID=2862510 RepID=UPI001C8EA557|nr:hypothetical protein [Oceanobacter mangrovi]